MNNSKLLNAISNKIKPLKIYVLYTGLGLDVCIRY